MDHWRNGENRRSIRQGKYSERRYKTIIKEENDTHDET